MIHRKDRLTDSVFGGNAASGSLGENQAYIPGVQSFNALNVFPGEIEVQIWTKILLMVQSVYLNSS